MVDEETVGASFVRAADAEVAHGSGVTEGDLSVLVDSIGADRVAAWP